MVLAFALELAQQPDVAAALRTKGLLGLLDHPAAAMVLKKPGECKGLARGFRELLIHCSTGQVSNAQLRAHILSRIQS